MACYHLQLVLMLVLVLAEEAAVLRGRVVQERKMEEGPFLAEEDPVRTPCAQPCVASPLVAVAPCAAPS
jgi:hypothetical protein